MTTETFLSFDNAEIFYRSWNYKPTQKTILILHRGHEHSGRLAEFANDKRFADYNIFAYDSRGLGYTKQEVSPIFMDHVRDLNAFVAYLKEGYGVNEKDIFVVANSIAGVTCSAWVHDFAPKIAGMALLAPAFDIKLYIPFAKECIALGTKMNKKLVVPSYVKSKVLTHDIKEQKAYNNDPLITKDINAGYLIDMLDGGKRIVEDAGGIDLPTLILSSANDYVVKERCQKIFFLRLESKIKEFVSLKGFFHGLLFEKDKAVVYDHIQRFMEKSFANYELKLDLDADKFTKDEHDFMSLKVLPPMQRLYFAFQKWSLQKLGFLSKGMKIGLEYGFDSGISLDYVYRNKPQGVLGIGKYLDYSYLNAIGWRGIRIRKKNLIQLIEQQIIELQEQAKTVRILDIAGGTGNYLFDIKKKFPDVEVVVNDFKKSNIEFGNKLLAESGAENMRFTNYDCFDVASYSKLNYTPNIIVISGVFELFGDNELINSAIKGAISISEEGARIVYTGQPWHPQLKKIAYVLNSHQEKDWIMRRRSQKELDKIFALNGLEKKKMLIDDYGIFTVTVGRLDASFSVSLFESN